MLTEIMFAPGYTIYSRPHTPIKQAKGKYQGQNQIFHVAGANFIQKQKQKSLLQSRKVDFQKDKKINHRGKNWRKTTALGKYFDELSAGSKYFDKLLMVS